MMPNLRRCLSKDIVYPLKYTSEYLEYLMDYISGICGIDFNDE